MWTWGHVHTKFWQPPYPYSDLLGKVGTSIMYSLQGQSRQTVFLNQLQEIEMYKLDFV